jgi:hypothetical protein
MTARLGTGMPTRTREPEAEDQRDFGQQTLATTAVTLMPACMGVISTRWPGHVGARRLKPRHGGIALGGAGQLKYSGKVQQPLRPAPRPHTTEAGL